MAEKVPSDTLRLDILPAAQRRLWDELGSTPSMFVLYGGTAIALRFGHRQSVDFDFFSFEKFDADSLLKTVPYLADGRILRRRPDSLDIEVERGDPIKVSYFSLAGLKPIDQPQFAEPPGVNLGALSDIGGFKLKALFDRAQWKDYIDIHVLLTQGQLELPNLLVRGVDLFGREFSPVAACKALSYFGDMIGGTLTVSQKKVLRQAVEGVDFSALELRLTKRGL